MLIVQIGLALALLAVCCFTPGFFFVRRLRWSPLEKLCGSAALSLILLYLAAWGIYCFSMARSGGAARIHPLAFALVSSVCVGLGVAAFRDIVRLLRWPAVTRLLKGLLFLLAWTFCVLAMIRVYSGGGWFGDWLEHFHRSLFFMTPFPTDTPIVGYWKLSARPPMMNVVAGFFLGQAGDRFEVFQVVFSSLNLLVFLPAALIMPALAGSRRRVLPLTALFAANPMLVQNITYTWTKALTAFFVILAFWFYLAGWRKRDSVRITAAFVCLAAGMLVHYSAGPYIALLVGHFLVVVIRKRPGRLREVGVIAALCGGLLATWFGWSLAAYGIQQTVASNSSITMGRAEPTPIALRLALNLADSMVPRILFVDVDLIRQTLPAGRVRDRLFLLYQVNLPAGLGVIGGPMAVWLAVDAIRRRRQKQRPERMFWLVTTPLGVILGLVVAGERDIFGLTHLTLLPLKTIGIAWLAGWMTRHRIAAMLLLAGCAIDFTLGVFLHAHIQSMENNAGPAVFRMPDRVGDRIMYPEPGTEPLTHHTWSNWVLKHQRALVEQWISEARSAGVNLLASDRRVRILYDEDEFMWHGWFSRHQGRAQYLGDHVPTRAAAAVLWIMFVSIIAGAATACLYPGRRRQLSAEGLR